MELQEIQEKARCNWCLNALRDQVKPITEANFIDTHKTFKHSSEPAFAVYCNECLASEYRTSQPKSAIDKKTLNVISMEDLGASSTKQSQQSQPQQTKQTPPKSATKPQEIS